ncbi:16312_t:CDS:2 [Acaulospora colombiana]|uniref:16312_t:CDS:1 n=1 Tax=Acaulospora colombiana TaxID=27376 RepID=A0ACA9KXB4_9GLOM|nr:16312_t:CDS:2 [Acaulospora colombiana]
MAAEYKQVLYDIQKQNGNRLGGNTEWREFYEASPDYYPEMSLKDKYNSSFAASYREKLTALCEGKKWTPSRSSSSRTSSRPSSANSKRSSVQSTSHVNSVVPSSYQSYQSNGSIPDNGNSLSSDKSRNEAYFASLGRTNETRSETLPPSQGGRYTGFGNPAFIDTPPSSSSSVPDLEELMNNPVGALTKGLNFLGHHVVEGAKLAAQGAETLGQTVNEHVIKPTAEKVRDPEFTQQLSDYVSGIGKTVTETASRGMSTISSISSTATSSLVRSNYGTIADNNSNNSGYSYNNDSDFFSDTINHYQQRNSPTDSRSNSPMPLNNGSNTRSASPKSLGNSATRRKNGKSDLKKDDGWEDEWKSW